KKLFPQGDYWDKQFACPASDISLFCKAKAESLVRFKKRIADLQKESIALYFEQANRAVLNKQTSSCQMKSTAVLLLCRNNQAIIAHVGDSRGYYFSNGSILFQTIDHSVSQMAVLRGEITAAQIRFHEDRNRLLRALGGEENVHAEVSLIPSPLAPGDAFLLCSDGFWEYVTENEMAIDLTKSATPDEWLSYLTARIGKRISGKNDNLSAIAIFCE
ncbi:MAG: hypothetical protein LBR75_04005, partial [Prevotellaceae bacterium]|nr:hypothetical protein [Prevotellaceae bacterium]